RDHPYHYSFPTRRSSDLRIIGLIEQKEINRPRLIINRIRQHMMNDGDALDIEDVVQLLSIDLVGIVLDSDDVIKAANSGAPVALTPDNKASIAYRNIARRILGESVPLQSFEQQEGFFRKFKRLFSKRS